MEPIVNDSVQKKEYRQVIHNVAFNSCTSIDTKGVVSLHSKIRNKSFFSKFKVRVFLEIVNNNHVVYLLDSGIINLYGTFISFFVPSKKSSTVVNKFGNITFDDLVLKDPIEYMNDSRVTEINNEISDVAREVRRLKILSEGLRDGQNDLRKEFERSVHILSNLKDKRMSLLNELETASKFKAVSLDVQHQVHI